MNTTTLDFILLIPCYNNLEGILKSVKSVKYPIHKFEILIVDDGSLEPILKENFDSIDPDIKIKIIRLNKNQGILNALNIGLKTLEKRNDYNYIARLDAGDTSHKERFIKQVQFLDSNSEIFLLGTWCRFEDPISMKGYDYITKTKHEDIIREMHFKCSFIHPTVMFRKEVLSTVGYYPEGYPHAEDYAYFWKILKKTKGEILGEVLVNIEYSNNNISAKNYKKQIIVRKNIVKEFSAFNWESNLGLAILMIKYLIPSYLLRLIKTSLK